MSKDIPSWQRTEPMTIDEARRKTLNWIHNSTSCCYDGPEGGNPVDLCHVHTPDWIEAEAATRMDQANQWMGWTNRLGDLVRGMSAVRAGRILADMGYRTEIGLPSEKAIGEGLATWGYHHGYPIALWNPERVQEALAGVTA